mmetsp:Transcript_21620/g.27752  ORF Transcript_21620/g.27752 Transcript_21620/m.27752 type:complete len:88 (-) Transcript_21620:151-414(-)|eukprot:CAMPEP_0184455414 /NCGR_PEP_ID=MMETSP0740-20130409/23368_1 /TAXON_ID=385413 /ORGANISM="Thalassiosira miniscula, Strain CCMP1093" /LENGTH=87 /DNA_ID=CAMNT_0026827251 /DNA_START=600 /DNA_END=863 /DNA_ORIENTATION=-
MAYFQLRGNIKTPTKKAIRVQFGNINLHGAGKDLTIAREIGNDAMDVLGAAAQVTNQPEVGKATCLSPPHCDQIISSQPNAVLNNSQ